MHLTALDRRQRPFLLDLFYCGHVTPSHLDLFHVRPDRKLAHHHLRAHRYGQPLGTAPRPQPELRQLVNEMRRTLDILAQIAATKTRLHAVQGAVEHAR
eukprot:350543-Pleurochrysis_carterae.AAC.1